MRPKKLLTLALPGALMLLLLAACTGGSTTQVETVVQTRVIEITREVEVAGTPQVITETLIETVEIPVTVTPAPVAAKAKDLIVCMSQEPDTLYVYGGSTLVAAAVQHGIYENDINSLSYGYQAQGLEKMPSLADGDAVLQDVTINAGDVVLVAGEPKVLEVGDLIQDAAGESLTFEGEPVVMQQLLVDFTMKQRVWADGTLVTAGDSVYSWELNGDPNTPAAKFNFDRTAAYEAIDVLTVRWTGIPGFLDSTYFLRFWPPLPRHAWEGFTAAELLEAEESSRLPMGDGAFNIESWTAGDNLRLVRNTNYYRADEGLPYLDSVTFKFIPDTNALIAQLLSGQCDIGTQDGLNVTQAPFLIEAENNGLLVPYFQTGTVYEHIDFGIDSYNYGDDLAQGEAGWRPDWFEDVRVRQAMTMCTDRQAMVDNILFGRSEVIHTYVPSVHPLYPEGLSEWPYDVDQANALLDEAGYVDADGDGTREDPATGVPFAITLGTTVGNEMREQLTQIFKENMLDCGIDVALFYMAAGEWFASGPEGPLFGRQFDLGEFAWSTGVEPSCSIYLTESISGPEEDGLGGWGNSNLTGWSNTDYDVICNTALSSLPGTSGYEDGHREAQRIFSQEVPVIPLFLRLKVAAARPNVLNFSVDPTQNSELYNLFELDLKSE